MPPLLSALALMTALWMPAAADASAGDLDPDFSSDGRVALLAAGAFVPRAVAIQPDGRIVVAGYSCTRDPTSGDATCLQDGDASFRLARLTPDGGLDPEFGDNGLVTTPVGIGRSQAFGLLVGADGRILLGGVARDPKGNDTFALAQYDSRGALDPAFGNKGAVVQPIGSGFAAIGDLARGPGGTIVATGQAQDPNGQLRLAVARFTATGALDTTYGSGGVTFAGPAYGFGLDVAVTPDGSAVAAGVAGPSPDPAGYGFGIAALSPSGALVPGFGGAGWAAYRFGTAASFANALLPSGAGWLAAGAASEADGRQVMALARLLGDGSLDPSFDADGYAVVRAGDGAVANDLVDAGGGRATVVGQAAVGSGFDFASARLLPDGSLDPAFAAGGLALTAWPSYPTARATAGALDARGRLVAVGLGCNGGSGVKCSGGSAVLLVARYLGDPPDPTALAPPDTRAPALRFSKLPQRIRRATLRRSGLRFTVACDEDCALDALLQTSKRRLAHAAVPLGSGPFKLRLQPARARVRRLRAVTLRITARDAAGNARTVRRTVRVR